MKHNYVLDEKKRKDGKNAKLPSVKGKRKYKKVQTNKDIIVNETKEGQTYQSGISMGPDGDHADIDTIPNETKPPIPERICVSDGEKVSVVVFDLETTGFGKIKCKLHVYELFIKRSIYWLKHSFILSF